MDNVVNNLQRDEETLTDFINYETVVKHTWEKKVTTEYNENVKRKNELKRHKKDKKSEESYTNKLQEEVSNNINDNNINNIDNNNDIGVSIKKNRKQQDCACTIF